MSTDRQRMANLKRSETQRRRMAEAREKAGARGNKAQQEKARAARVPITLPKPPWERRAREGDR